MHLGGGWGGGKSSTFLLRIYIYVNKGRGGSPDNIKNAYAIIGRPQGTPIRGSTMGPLMKTCENHRSSISLNGWKRHWSGSEHRYHRVDLYFFIRTRVYGDEERAHFEGS